MCDVSISCISQSHLMHISQSHWNPLTLWTRKVSLSPEVRVTPTLWVPFDNPSGNAFIYSGGPVHPFLVEQGINETTDYRVVMVRRKGYYA